MTTNDNATHAAPGLIETRATGSARDAADRLIHAIEANENLRLIAQVDHAAGAASVGLELRPTIEVFFGNPKLGTPLMQAAPTVGIDLPQKMLFIEEGDGARVLYNDPAYLAERHGLPADTPQLEVISGALAKLAEVASGR
jgi:uncharacterized protein (DUF302 family)